MPSASFTVTGLVIAWLSTAVKAQELLNMASDLPIEVMEEDGLNLNKKPKSQSNLATQQLESRLKSQTSVAAQGRGVPIPPQPVGISMDDILFSLGGLSAVAAALCAMFAIKLGWLRFMQGDDELPLIISVPLAVIHHSPGISPAHSPRNLSPLRAPQSPLRRALESLKSPTSSTRSPLQAHRYPVSPSSSARPYFPQSPKSNASNICAIFSTTGEKTRPKFVVDECHCWQNGVQFCQDKERLVYEDLPADADAAVRPALPQVSITTLNIHCPAHKRIGNGERESQDQDLFLSRNMRILEMLLEDPPTIVCLQEFWMCSSHILSLYQGAMGPAGYKMVISPRPKCRGDGLMTLVSTDCFDVLHHETVSYEDCGDRVAQVMHLTGKGMAPGEGEMLLINTHLMFQHDQNAELIRLRQCGKLLAFLNRYTAEHKLTNVPVVICGDWNGEPDGAVARFMQSQGFISAYDEHTTGQRWVSHLNHHKEAVGVDYIWILNPSARPGSLTADWKRMVCDCLISELGANSIRSQRDAFAFFDQAGRGYITAADLLEGCERLHMMNDDGIGLLSKEVTDLAEYLDSNGDGIIEFEDFAQNIDVSSGLQLLERLGDDVVEFVMTSNALRARQSSSFSDPTTAVSIHHDLQVLEASLPASFAAGVWPEGFEEDISDHAPLKALLTFPALEQKHVALHLTLPETKPRDREPSLS